MHVEILLIYFFILQGQTAGLWKQILEQESNSGFPLCSNNCSLIRKAFEIDVEHRRKLNISKLPFRLVQLQRTSVLVEIAHESLLLMVTVGTGGGGVVKEGLWRG